jgi:hypothetical protein
MDLATCDRGRAFGPITAASDALGVIGFMNAAFGFRFDFFAGAFLAFAFGFAAAFFLAFFFAAIVVLLGFWVSLVMNDTCFRRAKAKDARATCNREVMFSLGKRHVFHRRTCLSPVESLLRAV